ncbi:hypothetical protein MRB53_039250 [Persea americana]|nr:hypothetical protein MRB53_039250 [Persea americana]
MPERPRAGSSPLQTRVPQDSPSLLVTSPSRPPGSRLRNGSITSVGAVRDRGRRGTVNSSDLSSENDPVHPSPRRRQHQAHRHRAAGGRSSPVPEDANASQPSGAGVDASDLHDDDELDSDDDSLASGFSVDAGKPAEVPQVLPVLPPPRPISVIQPVSALTKALHAQKEQNSSPFDRFAILDGTGNAQQLYVKITMPYAANSGQPTEMILQKVTADNSPLSVAQAIGHCLWRYGHDKLDPQIPVDRRNVNWWTFRMVEDGEIDLDFPALGRTRPLSDFTSNNNRGQRGRSREKPKQAAAVKSSSAVQPQPVNPPQARRRRSLTFVPPQHPILGSKFANPAIRKDSLAMFEPYNAQQAQEPTGPAVTIKVHFTTNDLRPLVIPIEATTDTYIAEVFTEVCNRLKVDKAAFVLKVSNTTTVAPTDRTIEALGADHSSLDLVPRRFVTDGPFGFTNSPGGASTSPNAPILLTNTGTPKRGRRGIHPLAQQHSDQFDTAANIRGVIGAYKRYNVVRKSPMSFTPAHARTLALDGEYMHIMPGEAGRERLLEAAQGKTTTVHFSNVVGSKVSRKHPRSFRVVIYRERETKRYDFEAVSTEEATEIVAEIRNSIEAFKERL